MKASTTVSELDARGLLCPLPVRLAARRLEALARGERFLVVGDDPAMEADLVAWCRDAGHRLVAREYDGPVARCLIEKG